MRNDLTVAKVIEVSVQTIQGDINALCQAGIPICALGRSLGNRSDASLGRIQFRFQDERSFVHEKQPFVHKWLF